ncbi:hypothetical protein GCM10027162_68030 [Streptomyces incanus]
MATIIRSRAVVMSDSTSEGGRRSGSRPVGPICRSQPTHRTTAAGHRAAGAAPGARGVSRSPGPTCYEPVGETRRVSASLPSSPLRGFPAAVVTAAGDDRAAVELDLPADDGSADRDVTDGGRVDLEEVAGRLCHIG